MKDVMSQIETIDMNNVSTALVVGANGMVGSAICRKLQALGEQTILQPSRSELDLLDQKAVQDYFKENEIDHVYLAAAKVGGILANSTYPADFIYENLQIQVNVIHSAYESNIPKLLFLGSSCIYPKFASQPILEESLLTGALESTNEPYAIAKISGLKMCEYYSRQYNVDFRSIMPCNLYGINDNFHPENSHVIPALMRRIHIAKEKSVPEVVVWGSGEVLREFMHVDDLAYGSIHVMSLSRDLVAENMKEASHFNVGTGKEISISGLAQLISDIVGYKGNLVFDREKPDGTPRKVLSIDKISSTGWSPAITLEEGLKSTYLWFLDNKDEAWFRE